MDLETYLDRHELEVLRDDTHGNCVRIASAFIALNAVSNERPVRVAAIANHLAGAVHRSTVYEVVKDRPGFAQTTNGFYYLEQAALSPYLKPGEVYPKNFFVFGPLQAEIRAGAESKWQDVINWLGEDYLEYLRTGANHPKLEEARAYLKKTVNFEGITYEKMLDDITFLVVRFHLWRESRQ